MTDLTPTIQDLIDQGALFVCNHSGGKDSQAMAIKLVKLVPAKQLVFIHATLGEVEWEGALELAQKQAADAGCDFIVARAYFKDGSDKNFLNMVEKRHADKGGSVPPFPSGNQRYCTSDLKRGPIEREIIGYMKRNGFKLVVNCEGLRAAESSDRAKKEVFANRSKFNAKGEQTDGLSRAGRTAYDWLPIHTLSTADVFAMIAAAGQTPHWAYAKGNERLSCVFCIYGSKGDLARGAKQYPDLYAKFLKLEADTGYTMHMSRKPLSQLVAEAAL
jgi:3'-phosphoadenosine 5'-phosphosulfate sulfotransferase (PAPS reductase)/FAD synthetase